MKKYLAYTARLAADTPADRNRIVDFWRVLAILIVAFGHWLAASIWLMPDGEIALLNSLEWIPYAAWVTWIVQVMPIFFLAGGYANARGLRKVAANAQLRRDWITARARRLFTPVVPLLVVWVGLIQVMRTFVPPEVIYAGAMSATVPLWFLAVYLILNAIAPLTHAWWERSGVVTILILSGAAIAVDVARFALDVPGIGWANFLFVWATVHQVGYWWSTHDRGDGVPARTGWMIFGTALALLIAVTWIGWYPGRCSWCRANQHDTADVRDRHPQLHAIRDHHWHATQRSALHYETEGVARRSHRFRHPDDHLLVAPLGDVTDSRGRSVHVWWSSLQNRTRYDVVVGDPTDLARCPRRSDHRIAGDLCSL